MIPYIFLISRYISLGLLCYRRKVRRIDRSLGYFVVVPILHVVVFTHHLDRHCGTLPTLEFERPQH